MTTFANSAQTRSAVEVRGPAATTALASTQGVATDSYGNVYITTYDVAAAAPTATSGTGSSYLHRVDIATGGLFPIAGQFVKAVPASGTANTANASATYCAAATDNVGDGCPGTQATLFSPYQPFVDALGNVFFVDQKNLLIRKVSTNTVFPTTAVGKSATQSLLVHFGAADLSSTYTFKSAAGFTTGTAACTLNSDTTTDCVLPVTFTPTVAGNSSSLLTVTSSSGLTGTFNITGLGQAALLAIDPAVATTLASTNLTAVGNIAVDSLGNVLATVPTATSIAKYSPAGTASTVGTSLSGATAVTTDPLGNVYAALASGSVIEITATGAQVTLATGFTRPSGIVADPLGNVYVADSAANTVTQIYPTTAGQRVIATAASAALSGPTGLALDLSGNLFIANTVANNIVEIPASGATPIAFGSGLSSPLAVATDAAGSVYVADSRSGRIVFIPNESGTLTTADQLAVVSGLSSPSGVAIAPGTATLYVADSTANVLYTYARSASTLAFGNDPVATQLTAAADLISAGNLPVTFASPYVAAAGNTTDFTVTPTTGPTTLAAGQGLALTAGFKPTVAGARSATFTFNSAVLTLTGTGIVPVNATTTTISATPTTGTYGATVAVTFSVAVPAGKATATGTVTVKVDTTTYTPTLNASGVATLSLTGLSAATHTITANYPGDSTSSPSTAAPVTVTLAPAPLTIAPAPVTKAYYAAIPTLTGTLTGVVNGDTIGVTYATTATQTSAIGTYPITATVNGTAAANYTVTVTPGVLTIVKAGTTTLLTTSATAVASTTSVTLTATITPVTGGVPTSTVSFYNGTVLIATVALTNGSASTTTTFAVVGQSSTNVITAIYSGDNNYTTSTSSPVSVISSTPGFGITGAPTTVSVVQGQTALLSFTVTPTFGYTGTIVASCSNLPATIGCVFSPSSITSTGVNTPSLIAMSLTTVQPGGLVYNTAPTLTPRSTVSFALLPGFALLLGLATRRRKFRSLLSVLVLAVSAALAVGLSGCGQGHFATPTPVGTYTVTVNVTGTPNTTAPTANLTSSFPVALTVTSK